MELRDRNGLSESEFLARYSAKDYPRPSVAVDIVIFAVGNTPETNYRKLPQKELRVLLIQRGEHPFLGKWALPGGFVQPSETVGEAALRELREETGVESARLEQLYTFSEPGRDPRAWVMSCAHMALLESGDVCLAAGYDAGDARWFKATYTLQQEKKTITPTGLHLSQQWRLVLTQGETVLAALLEQVTGPQGEAVEIVENDGLAFDHAMIIAHALHRLRGEVNETGIALNLMPQRFTLTELQQVYEVILGAPLYKAAFRRKVRGLVQETGEYIENTGHRPSQLFCRKREESQ